MESFFFVDFNDDDSPSLAVKLPSDSKRKVSFENSYNFAADLSLKTLFCVLNFKMWLSSANVFLVFVSDFLGVENLFSFLVSIETNAEN